MPDIRLKILAYLDEIQFRRTEVEAKERFERMGQQAGDDLTKGIERAAPKIRTAMNSAADATTDYTRRTEALTKAQEERNKTLEHAATLEQSIPAQYDRNSQAAERVAASEDKLKEARRDQSFATASVTNRENNLREKRAEHADTTALLAKKELELKQIRLDSGAASQQAKDFDKSLMDLRRQKADETAYIATKENELATARATLRDRTAESERAETSLKEVRAEHAKGVSDLDSAERDLLKTRQDAAKADDDIIKRNDDVERSHRRRSESLRRLIEAEGDNDRRGGGGIFGGGGGGGYGGRGPLAGILPGGARAGAGVYAAAAPLAGDLAMALVTASQAAAVLPAVAAAGAAGLLTLTIGFDDLSKAIKDVGDPKKFAQDLQAIGPAAQQVALEIQYLTQGPLKDLKAAVEDSLFKGVPEKLHNLANTLLPSVKELTTGVGDAFNQMFGAFAGQLTTPESLKSIHEIVNNIVTAFHALAPAVAPFIDALTKITQTGSTFLPGFATSIADAARSFDDFITKAQQSGKLQEFIQKGVDAVKVFGQELFILGQKIYEVFGNKTPDQFKQLLDDVVNAVITIGKVLEGAGRAANVFLQWLQKIADMVGGYQTLFEVGFGFFLGGKILGVIANLSKVAGLLGAGEGGIGAGLAGIPALAGAAGLALAALALPAWIVELIKKAPYVAPDAAGQPGGKLDPSAFSWAGQSPNQTYANGGLSGYLADSRDANGKYPGEPGYAGPATQAPPPSFAPPPPPGTTGGTAGQHDLGNPFTPPPGPGGPTTWGGPPGPDSAGLPPYHPFDVPGVPGPKVSKSNQITAARDALNPNDFAVDPFAGTGFDPSTLGGPQTAPGPGSPGGPGGVQVGGGPGLPPLEYGTNGKPYAKPGYGYESVDQQAVMQKAEELQKDAWSIQGAQMDLEALKKSGVGTQKEIIDLEHKVLEEKWKLQNDQAALIKLQEGKWNPVTGSKGSSSTLGPGIDPGFGIAQGLPGLADNLVKFVGSLLMAPVLAALQQMTGGKSESETGYGLIGSLAAQGAFGPDFTGAPGAPGQSSALGSGPAYSGVGGGAPGAAAPGESARDFAHRVEMPFFQRQGFTVGDHAADQYGEHQNGALDIMVSSLAQGQQVLQQVLSDPNVYGAIFNRQSYGYGHGTGGQPYTGDNPHTDHVHAWFQPGRAGDISPTGAGPFGPAASGLGGPSALSSSSGGVVPVFVTNMDGGGLGGGPAVGSPVTGNGGGPQAGPGQGGLSPEQWQKIAGGPGLNESGGNWKIDHGQGNDVTGGLQISTPTWLSHGGGAYGPKAMYATPEQQMEIANKIFADQGASAWPAVSAAHPELFQPGAGSLPAVAPTGGMGFPLPTTPFNPFGPRPGPGLPDVSGTVRVPGGATSEPNSQSGIQSPFGTPQILSSSGGPGAPGPGGPPAGPPIGGPPAAPGPGTPGPAAGPVGRSSGEGGWQPSGPGAGQGGGAIGAAGEAASMGLDAIAPGAGQAAQTATKLINRTIQFGGQLAAIGVSGMMETFGLNGSPLGDPTKSWFGRIVSGFAQAKPAVPTTAGSKDKEKQQQQQQGPNGPQGPAVNIENFHVKDSANGQDMMNQLAQQATAAPLKRSN